MYRVYGKINSSLAFFSLSCKSNLKLAKFVGMPLSSSIFCGGKSFISLNEQSDFNSPFIF